MAALPMEVLNEIIKLHGKTSLGGKLPAYDGRKSLYTAGSLPFDSKDFVVKLNDPEKNNKERYKTYNYRLKYASWPYLQSGSDSRPVYLPMEFLHRNMFVGVQDCRKAKMVLHNKYTEDRFAQEFGIKMCSVENALRDVHRRTTELPVRYVQGGLEKIDKTERILSGTVLDHQIGSSDFQTSLDGGDPLCLCSLTNNTEVAERGFDSTRILSLYQKCGGYAALVLPTAAASTCNGCTFPTTHAGVYAASTAIGYYCAEHTPACRCQCHPVYGSDERDIPCDDWSSGSHVNFPCGGVVCGRLPSILSLSRVSGLLLNQISFYQFSEFALLPMLNVTRMHFSENLGFDIEMGSTIAADQLAAAEVAAGAAAGSLAAAQAASEAAQVVAGLFARFGRAEAAEGLNA
uniref:Protein argonaute N-terminal domain-containing protein n=1 Tax=Oryza punctata TaxID=4537 RepID=A0A0E0KGX9_ORYPU